MGARLIARRAPIEGVYEVETSVNRDPRGSFARLYCETELAPLLCGRRIAQVNISRTSEVGAVRGLHYQRAPHAEMKFVRCLRGRVWDVAVDLRAGSPTFLKWHAAELSEENARMIVIPEGCAHGFQVLEACSELLYLHTADYVPDAEGGVAWNDARLAIAWPQGVTQLSERDRKHPPVAADFPGLTT